MDMTREISMSISRLFHTPQISKHGQMEKVPPAKPKEMFTHPRIVSRILMKKSTLQPEIISTPRGGTSNQIHVRMILPVDTT